MPLPISLAHRRYVQQAGWTTALRRHLFALAGLPNAQRVLEVGCGTGAVLRNVAGPLRAALIGLDIDLQALEIAKTHAPQSQLSGGDAHSLPYGDESFDITFCHFVLLWLTDPLRALREVRRVTRPGGAVLAFAEPDYGGRIDYPESLAAIGKLQTQALRQQGADPEMGRKLPGLFQAAGFTQIESGILGAEWKHASSEDELNLEREVLLEDLKNDVDHGIITKYLEAYKNAWKVGSRVFYVPTFYAWGRVEG